MKNYTAHELPVAVSEKDCKIAYDQEYLTNILFFLLNMKVLSNLTL